MFTFLFISSNLLGHFLAFFFVLKLLKVEQTRGKRALYLTLILTVISFVSSLVIEQTPLNPEAAGLLTFIIFVITIRRFLVLKVWQSIVIPLFVTLVGQLTFAVTLSIYLAIFDSI